MKDTPIIHAFSEETLRDWFAGMALQGIKSNEELCHTCSQVEGLTQQEAVARMAYIDADAMMKERAKHP